MLKDGAIEHLKQVVSEPDLSGTQYRVLGILGQGGMATVYLAFDRELEREVALKVLDFPDSEGQFAKRMLREARIVAALEHPGIVPIHDVGVLPDERVFYVMKHVKGERLDNYAQRNLSERLRVFQKICEAVAFAHARGVVHRDLKPQNIMVGGFGEVLVMDWGLAKILRQSDPDSIPAKKAFMRGQDLTDHGFIMGTPGYMAPEQAAGDPAKTNESMDVYALGAILYFLLTGNSPEPAPAAPREKDSGIARAVQAICLKAMAHHPEDRYKNAEDLGYDVSRYLNGLSVSAYRENPIEMIARWVRRNSFVVLLVLAYLIMRVALLLIAGR